MRVGPDRQAGTFHPRVPDRPERECGGVAGGVFGSQPSRSGFAVAGGRACTSRWVEMLFHPQAPSC